MSSNPCWPADLYRLTASQEEENAENRTSAAIALLHALSIPSPPHHHHPTHTHTILPQSCLSTGVPSKPWLLYAQTKAHKTSYCLVVWSKESLIVRSKPDNSFLVCLTSDALPPKMCLHETVVLSTFCCGPRRTDDKSACNKIRIYRGLTVPQHLTYLWMFHFLMKGYKRNLLTIIYFHLWLGPNHQPSVFCFVNCGFLCYLKAKIFLPCHGFYLLRSSFRVAWFISNRFFLNLLFVSTNNGIWM